MTHCPHRSLYPLKMMGCLPEDCPLFAPSFLSYRIYA